MGSREWAENHIGADLLVRDERWTLVAVDHGKCILENADERIARLDPATFQRRWVRQNQPEDYTTS